MSWPLLSQVRMVAVISIAILAAMGPQCAHAGAGIALLAVFEPEPQPGISEARTSEMATAVHREILNLMDSHDVWGIELLSMDAATSSALASIETRHPRWSGTYTSGWIRLLNTNEMITYALLGQVRRSEKGPDAVLISYELRDFILNERITSVTVESDVASAARRIATETLAALQTYFAEVTEVADSRCLINIGIESVSTGTRLRCFAHGHLGTHPLGYPSHGHKEEDDHLFGSEVYARYRGTKPTSATIHSHSRSTWRSLLRAYPPAYETQTSVSAGIVAATDAVSTSSTTDARDLQTTIPAEELRLLNLAHLMSGRPTGVIRVTGFVQPHSYYRRYFAIAEVESGMAIPGSFVRKIE